MSNLILYKNFTFGASQASEYSDSSKTHDLSLNYHIKNIGIDTYVHMSARNGTTGVYFFNQTYKNQVFPNGIAPLKRFEWNVRNVGSLGSTTSYAWHFTNTSTGVDQEVAVWSHTSKIGAYGGDHSGGKDITNGLTRDACELQLHCTSRGSVEGLKTLSFYFTRYDFSAVAGNGVTSASVSSSTGYTGAQITCSCVIPTGYVFDGWYDEEGGFRASTTTFVYTVGTRDHTFTAKAHQDTHNVNGSYYFGTDTSPSTKAILTGISGNVGVSYNNGSKNCTTTLNTTNNYFEIDCGGKVAANNINVGSVPLECAGKLMRSNLKLNYV